MFKNSPFGRFASRLAAALRFSKPAEKAEIVKKLDAAVSATAARELRDYCAADVSDSYGRKERRRKQRTRRTGISRRSPARYAQSIHDDANNKFLNYINNARLHGLLNNAGVLGKEYRA